MKNPFNFLGSLLGKAVKAARGRGLDDALVATALKWARVAEHKFLDDESKRSWVVAILVSRGVPPAIAALAVECAVQLLHAEMRDAAAK